MSFYAYHGHLPEERKVGQKFFADLTLYLDLRDAGMRDSIRYTLNYKSVYQLVKEVMEERRYKLLEALSQNILSTVFEKFPIVTF